MRPVDKGNPPNGYANWGDARNDLGDKLDWCCSYCEMKVTNMLEVEHVVPRSHGGAPLDWENFLISCKYCNTVKGNRNTSRIGYLWPDRDNCDLAFVYSEQHTMQPAATSVQANAQATIDLMGLDRKPGGLNAPTDADSRWIFRLQAWLIAKSSLRNWHINPTQAMAEQIALTAYGHGFYSIWVTVFSGIEPVIVAIRKEYKSTYFQVDTNGHRTQRPNGII